MKKLICSMAFALLLFVACGNDDNDDYEYHSEPEQALTLEEMGNMIVAAGEFWESWWRNPDGIAAGFDSLEAVRNHLSQFYSDNFLDTHLESAFYELDGELRVNATRIGTMRYMWGYASHVLIAENIVETSFRKGYPRGGDWWTDIHNITFQSHFVDGRIDVGTSPWGWDDDVIWTSRIWSDEELEQVIMTAGDIWESWWNFEHTFFGMFVHEDDPQHITDLGYGRFSPYSWMYDGDPNDLRRWLSHWYTDNWINDLFGEEIPIFRDYNNVLYVMMARNIHPRPDWRTAAFEIFQEAEGRHRVDVQVHQIDSAGMFQGLRLGIFILIDGRIDEGMSPWFTWEDIWQ